MTNSSSGNTPEITIFFSIGIIGMDENATEYITVPLISTEGDSVLGEQLAMKGQIAQMRLQLSFLELMTTQFPEWVKNKAQEEGWQLPDNLLE